MIKNVLASFLVLVVLTGCSQHDLIEDETSDTTLTPGVAVSVEKIKHYHHLVVRLLFWMNDISDVLPTEHGINLYRVIYGTTAPDGRVIQASGLLALPDTPAPYRGVISWQHGTASLSADAPSNLSAFNGILPAAVFAGHGYVLLAPDYIGYGVSDEPHSYYETTSMAHSVTDFIAASRGLLHTQSVPWPSGLFLTGFSQGGHASLAAQRQIEANNHYDLNLVASAPVAAAVDLSDAAFGNTLLGRSKFSSLYIAWIAESYSRDYGLTLSSAIRKDWVPVVEQLFDGKHTGEEILTTLPADPLQLLTEEVVDAYRKGEPHRFLTLLQENELLDWTPRAPICVYYGELDVDVTPVQAEALSTLSETTHGRSVGEVDHEGSILLATPALRRWFDKGAPAGDC